jgi:GNAT superfamily N-acetyltransferase
MAHPPVRPDGKLDTVVTSLEMFALPTPAPLPPPRAGLSIVQAVHPTVSFYRYLYNTVGDPWLWSERRMLSDAELAAIIHDPDDETFVLYADGVPAGYVELDARKKPEIELAYLGIMPEFIGQKLGPYILSFAIHKAFEKKASRFWVHTCTLDHPSALAMYKRGGFVAFKEEVEQVYDSRAL